MNHHPNPRAPETVEAPALLETAGGRPLPQEEATPCSVTSTPASIKHSSPISTASAPSATYATTPSSSKTPSPSSTPSDNARPSPNASSPGSSRTKPLTANPSAYKEPAHQHPARSPSRSHRHPNQNPRPDGSPEHEPATPTAEQPSQNYDVSTNPNPDTARHPLGAARNFDARNAPRYRTSHRCSCTGTHEKAQDSSLVASITAANPSYVKLELAGRRFDPGVCPRGDRLDRKFPFLEAGLVRGAHVRQRSAAGYYAVHGIASADHGSVAGGTSGAVGEAGREGGPLGGLGDPQGAGGVPWRGFPDRPAGARKWCDGGWPTSACGSDRRGNSTSPTADQGREDRGCSAGDGRVAAEALTPVDSTGVA